MHTEFPAQRDLVLIGGGHSHVAVIRQFGMKPIPGLRVTVLSSSALAPYSGMLPGWLAGHYQADDCFIDLRRLCQWAGCRLFESSATAIDTGEQTIVCDNRPPLRYDWLSINVGSTPDLSHIPGARDWGVGVKPIQAFNSALNQWLEQRSAHGPPQTLAVVGGGAAGVELILAISHRIRARRLSAPTRFLLLSSAQTLLPSHNARVRQHFSHYLAAQDITFLPGHRVISVGEDGLQIAGKPACTADFIIWALHAAAPGWLHNSGLDLDKAGFIAVGDTLQSRYHDNVFAAGDCISLEREALPKSGVYAVRQGPLLADNLRRRIQGNALRHYRPQRRFLSLLATGDRRGVASRGRFFASGAWVWRWKDRIDRNFMRQFNELPPMETNSAGSNDPFQQAAMRCGGCGAKVGADVLNRVLRQIAPSEDEGAAPATEDATIFTPPAGRQMVQTIDHFRAFIDDPYLFGAIAANHCLGDIYAMGATPVFALALANIPYSHPRIAEDTLLQLMQGAMATLRAADTALGGGHSAEAGELAFGLSVNGILEPGSALRKGGLQSGQALVLTKALGTGTLLAANMRHRAKAHWMDDALAHMQTSNAAGAAILRRFGATACTDITGFGLLGHALEMLRASDLAADLSLHAVPLLAGAEACLQQGIFSTLHPANLTCRRALDPASKGLESPRELALYDPQTAGGLLSGIPPAQLSACLAALAEAGYRAAHIGHVHSERPAGTVRLL